MGQRYEFGYYDDNLYGHAIALLKEYDISGGIHLDIGCGYGAIGQIIEKQLGGWYVGIDADIKAVQKLIDTGMEAHQYTFVDCEKAYSKIKEILGERKLSSITALDFAEHLINPWELFKLIGKLATEYRVPVVLSVPNITHQDIAFKLLDGRFDYTQTGLLDDSHYSFFTENRLISLAEEAGLKQVKVNDFKLERSDQYFPDDNTFLAEGSLLHQHLKMVKTACDSNATVNQFVRAFLPSKNVPVKQENEERPFLSVLMRTQGKRLAALKEVLLCLAGQTSMNFEVMLMGHKLTIDAQIKVEQAIEGLPEYLKQKVRLIKVDYGNRTAPLTEGFLHAKGRYVSILDDDDLVFDHWVESFEQIDKDSPGTVLHSYVLKQDWEMYEGQNGTQFMRAVGPVDNVYCKDFHWLNQLCMNRCPTFALAYPVYAFQKLGIRFDETLTTTEDWDFLMRMAFVCGVADKNTVTGIYRIWKNAESSATMHDDKEWERNYKFVQAKLARNPILLPPSAVGDLIQHMSVLDELQTFYERHQSQGMSALNGAKIYIDDGSGLSEKNTLKGHLDIDQKCFCLKYDGMDEFENINFLRWDPTEDSRLFIADLRIELFHKDKTSRVLSMSELSTNGAKIGNGFFCIEQDPQIYFYPRENEDIEKIVITGKGEAHVPDELLVQALAGSPTPESKIKKAIRKVKNKIKK